MSLAENRSYRNADFRGTPEDDAEDRFKTIESLWVSLPHLRNSGTATTAREQSAALGAKPERMPLDVLHGILRLNVQPHTLVLVDTFV
jgi:hypothetical protein